MRMFITMLYVAAGNKRSPVYHHRGDGFRKRIGCTLRNTMYQLEEANRYLHDDIGRF